MASTLPSTPEVRLSYARDMGALLPAGDQKLVQIIDLALTDTARRSGEWLVCKPGCTQCCMGAFAINQLDAVRLQQGLAESEVSDPGRAREVRQRARKSIVRLADDFPGDPKTGILNEGEVAEGLFEEFANDEPCPVLDPQTGMCDLYTARPLTCRIFGPPVESEDGLGVCELCYQGASEEEIAACEMKVDPDGVEPALVDELERSTGRRGRTIVAFAVGL
jgi:Fe-S-cluster containining protein